MDTTNAKKLAEEVKRAKASFDSLSSQLRRVQESCKHEWAPVQYRPRIIEGYYSPGDPPGTMGIDRRLPAYVPRQETRVWVRECAKCGLQQTTERTKQKRISGSIPGTASTQEVPDFPEPEKFF